MEALLAALARKSQEYGIPMNSYEGYAALVRYLYEAKERIASLDIIEAAGVHEIDVLFTAELGCMALVMSSIFSGEGIEELSTYLPQTS